MIDNDKTPTPQSENKVDRKSDVFKNIPCFLAKCTILTIFALGMIEIFKKSFVTGLIIVSVLCFLFMICGSLISWKKKQDKKDGYIEKEG